MQNLINIINQQQLPVLMYPENTILSVANSLNVKSSLDYSKNITEMPGPTGESNRLSTHARGLVLCLGPSRDAALEQAISALSVGNTVVIVAPGITDALELFIKQKLPVAGFDGELTAEVLYSVNGYDAVLTQVETVTLQSYREALAKREGVLIPLITEANDAERLVIERHLCIDTTAAGGNASLIAAGS